ncbi:MAG TPA: acyl-CoA dehydrogenase family protein [Bryobacteraceae bacterium]|nr:acyl-CoA dehydrogenase family protein [Bryobacteraceae bacterium]
MSRPQQTSHPYVSPWINDEIQLFRKTVKRFVQEEFVPHEARWREQHRVDAEAWTRAGEVGILLTDVPEEYGGGGGNYGYEAVVTEELCYGGVHFGHGVHSIAAHYILDYGNEDQKAYWLPRMAKGELIGSIAMTEPVAGSDLQNIKTVARRQGECLVINGSKTFITNGWHTNLIVLAVKTGEALAGAKGISLVVVEARDLAGYRVGRTLEKIGMHGQDTCELFFDDVRVPAQNLLGGEEGRGFYQMMEQLPYERMGVSVGATATTEQAVAITTKHCKERAAFGKKLIDFQNTRFKLAECKAQAHIMRVFLDSCIERLIEGKLDTATAAMAKYWLTDRECDIIDECVQLHGGYGYMMEYPIARMWTDSRVQRIYAGTNEIMKELIARSL